jgi:superfamily I DNA and/or RNA helicase
MTINPKQHLVLVKGEDKTEEILKIEREYGHAVVTFKKGKPYRYNANNVEWLSNPERIPIQDSRFSIGGDLLSDVGDVLRFGKWVKVFHKTGASRCCPPSALSIQQMKLADGRSKDVLAYFRELAEGASLRTVEDDSLLAMKYLHLNSVPQRSILSGFLQNLSAVPRPTLLEPVSHLIFPFGCNMSQKLAVQAALHNPISLIQGPPGTGKTQTILNLIANLLLQRKQVAVVSNNNSATANVYEKMKKYSLDFLTAFLGRAENRAMFIETQVNTAIQMPSLQEGEQASVRGEIARLNQELDKAFKTKNDLAALIQQVDAFRLELNHYERFLQETKDHDSKVWDRSLEPKAPSRELMKHWLTCERMARSHTNKKTSVTSVEKTSSDGYFALTIKTVQRICLDLLEIIRLLLRFGSAGRIFFKLSIEECISILQKTYYLRKIEELIIERDRLQAFLAGFHFDERLERLTKLSMQLLKHHLAGRYNNRERKIFTLGDLSRKPEEFLEEYPIVLSTTFSVITSVKSGYLFDCVIVDEASQVDLLNGGLAMGCAKNLVIVGDPMQLPNVLTAQDKKHAEQVALKYDLPEYVRFERHNLLSAVRAAFPEIPKTLLREHYRCHPKIIDFCNQKFYGGELLVMTLDAGEPDVLKACVTVEGHHARGNFNQRQIDEIVLNVLPELTPIDSSDIGIITPYKAQVAHLKSSVGSNEIKVDTVHKYQGREKRVIVITMVSNEANEFVDDPNLLNVAISRAQEKIRIVVSKEMAEGKGNIADFIRYIRYKNCEVVPGKIRSIFDLLYREYTEARFKLLKNRKRVSKYDSENIAHGEIEAVLQEVAFRGYNVVSQVPLSMLVQSMENLTAEECSYTIHPWTKTDFLIFQKVDKCPPLVIEVDGYGFHRERTRQAQRDALKDSVLKKCGLPILRLSTVGSNERDLIRKKLEAAVGGKDKPL